DGGQISGSVVDDQRRPAALSNVILIPVRSERRDLYRLISADGAGRFTMGSVPPGDYKVFAVAPEDLFSFLNPAVRGRLEQTGTALTVGPVSNLTIDLKLLPPLAPR